MAKKQQREEAPARRAVRFNFAAPEVRTERIELPGLEPFEISFRVPAARDMAELGIDVVGVGRSNDAKATRGDAMIRFSARHLTAWSLPHPVGYKSLDAIQDTEVLFAIFNAIARAGRASKN